MGIVYSVFWVYQRQKLSTICYSLFTFAKAHALELVGFGLLLLGLVLSTVSSADIRTGLGVIKSWFLVPFFFALSAIFILNTRYLIPNTRLLWQSLAASGVTVSLIAFGYALLGQFTFDGRLRAFYDSPNQLGMYLAITLVTTAWLARKYHGSSIKYQVFITLAFLLQLLVLYLTQSQSGMLGALAGLAAILFWPRFKKIHNTKYLILNTVLLAVYLLASILITTQVRYFLAPADRSSLASRAQIWQAAWDIGKDNWFLGIGPRQFQAKYLEYQPKYPPYLEWAAPQPHNLLLATWLQAGLVGLVGFLLLISRRAFNPIILALLVMGLFDTPVLAGDTSFTLFLFVLTLGNSRMYNQEGRTLSYSLFD